MWRRHGTRLSKTINNGMSKSTIAPPRGNIFAPVDQTRTSPHCNTSVLESKSMVELFRALAVFSTCRMPLVVKFSEPIIYGSYKVFGQSITNTLLRATFFGHFCAGENASEIQPVVSRLHARGIGAILDYAAEADVEKPRDLNGIPPSQVSARTFQYEGEQECDENLKIAMRSIEDAANSSNGFSAVKCTALGKPELLMRISAILIEARRLFNAFDGPNLSGNKKSVLEHWVSYPTFSAGFQNAGVDIDEAGCRRVFEDIDRDKNGVIDYFDWLSFLNPLDLTMGPLTQFFNVGPLSPDEKFQLSNMMNRLENLAARADELNVRLMVDAEQTYMQPAIDHLVLNLQRKYNRRRGTIYNTFQCYLKDSEDRLLIDLRRAKEEGFHFACKLVRGAYMVQERKRSRDMGYTDPIHPSIEATHENYDNMIKFLLKSNTYADFMVASHNEVSVRKTITWMKEMKLDPLKSGVFFGQLYGMCDYLSYSLGDQGFATYKYLPYGPIQEVLPYLIRRAQENSDMLANAHQEATMVTNEIKRRVCSILGN